jgi:hypothetical protein
MTYVIEHRESGLHKTVWGYEKPCGTSASQKTAYDYESREIVETYRGKPKFVWVGQQKRKAFHLFYRFRMTQSQTAGHWCGVGRNTYWGQGFPMSWLHLYDKDYAGFGGSDVPPVTAPMLKEIGEHYRDFAIRDVFAKANAPSFNTAVFLAELTETLVGIRALLVGAVKVLLKSGEAWKAVKHFSLNSEELWLWYRYALLPCILEVQTMVEAIQDSIPSSRVQDGGREKFELDGELGCIFHRGLSKEFNATVAWKAKVKVGCGSCLDIHTSFDPHKWGTSLNDIVLGAWNVIPFSFLFDWFVNLGDWISSLRQIDIHYAQSYATYAVETEVEFDHGSFIFESNVLKTHSFLQQRIVDIEPPPLPMIDKDWANMTRTCDLISLTVGMLKGILKKGK